MTLSVDLRAQNRNPSGRLLALPAVSQGRTMAIDHDLDQILAADASGCGVNFDDEPTIPAPRSGRSYQLYLWEADQRHGCLDSMLD